MQCIVPRDLDGIQYNVTEIKQHVVEWLKELEVRTGGCSLLLWDCGYAVLEWFGLE